MPRQYTPDPRCKKHISYKKEDIERALEDLRANKLSYRVAAAKYNIEYTVLYRHNTRSNVKKLGGQTALIPEAENAIVENINVCAEWGFPMDQYDLRLLVKIFLDKKGIDCKRFKNNMPGAEFAASFLKRHKNKISERYAQNIKRARANISSESINNYFDQLTETLNDGDGNGTTYLIGDNLSCHLSLDAIKVCTENDIRLIFLPPNSTHLTQPLDVAFFRPLKIAWREILLQWKKKEGTKEKSLPKSIFPRLLNSLYNKIQTNVESNLKSGFKKTGIFPLNRQEVLSRLPDYNSEGNNDTNVVNDSVIALLKHMRQGAEEEPQKKKKRLEVAPGESVNETETFIVKDQIKAKEGPKKSGKSKSTKGLIKNKNVKSKKENLKKTEVITDENITAINKIVTDFEPKAGPSNILMCRVCHSVKKRDDTWIKCNACKNQICQNCAGDVLQIEFICLRCFQVDSDDSAVDEDYNPVKSGYSAYDEGSWSSD